MSNRKKILYVASRVPFPPNKGEKIRTFRCLDHLASSHDVYCAFFTDGPEDNPHIESLRQWCADVAAVPRPAKPTAINVLDLFARGQSVSMTTHRSEAMAEVVSNWRRSIDFDIAVAFSAFMGPYGLAAGARRTVLDLCDCDSEKWREYGERSRWPFRALWSRESKLLRQIEGRLIARYDATIVINERERRALDSNGQSSNVSVVPNGVERPFRQPPSASSIGPVVTFFGALDYRPNVDGVRWFATHVWPRIHRANPDALFLIAGHRPTRAIEKMGERPGIRTLGAFESLDALLTKTRVVVVPLRIARGMQNKVLEAMAWRRPVVATGAVVAGLRSAHGERLVASDDPVDMAEQVIQLLRDGTRADALADRGYRYVAAFHRWPEHLATFERIVLGAGHPVEQEVPQLQEESGGVASALTDLANDRVAEAFETSGTFDGIRTSGRRRRRHFSVSAFVESST